MLLLLAVFVGFACLFPLALYLLIIASLNNCPRPTLVSGGGDFLGLLGGLSGFLIVGGPLALSGLREGWRQAAARGDLHGMADAVLGNDAPWRFVWLAYALAVVVAAVAGWLRRRRATLVYQIDPAVGRALFAEVCEQCGLDWDRAGPTFALWSRDPKQPGRGEVELQVAAASKHLTLDWRRADAGLRERVETAFAAALADVDAPDNPAYGWLLGVATVLFAALVFGLTVLILALVSARR
jgi:hypothetical protein